MPANKWQVRLGTKCLICGRELSGGDIEFSPTHIKGTGGTRYACLRCHESDIRRIKRLMSDAPPEKVGKQGDRGFEYQISLVGDEPADFEKRVQLNFLGFFSETLNCWTNVATFGNIQKFSKMADTLLECLPRCSAVLQYRIEGQQNWTVAIEQKWQLSNTFAISAEQRKWQIMDFIRFCKELALLTSQGNELNSLGVKELIESTRRGTATFQCPARNKGRYIN